MILIAEPSSILLLAIFIVLAAPVIPLLRSFFRDLRNSRPGEPAGYAAAQGAGCRDRSVWRRAGEGTRRARASGGTWLIPVIALLIVFGLQHSKEFISTNFGVDDSQNATEADHESDVALAKQPAIDASASSTAAASDPSVSAPVVAAAAESPANKHRATSSVTAISAERAPTKLPDWVSTPPHVENNVYVMVARSGPFVTIQEATRALGDDIRRQTGKYIEKYLGDDAKEAGPYIFDDSRRFADLRSQIVRQNDTAERESSVGMMHESYARLEFDNSTKAWINEALKNARVEERLVLVSLASAVVVAVLLVALLVLRRGRRNFSPESGLPTARPVVMQGAGATRSRAAPIMLLAIATPLAILLVLVVILMGFFSVRSYRPVPQPAAERYGINSHVESPRAH